MALAEDLPEDEPSLPPLSPPPVAPAPLVLGLEPIVNATAACFGAPGRTALPLDAGEEVGVNVVPDPRVAGEAVGVKVAGEEVGVKVGVANVAGEVVGVNAVGLALAAAAPACGGGGAVDAVAVEEGGGCLGGGGRGLVGTGWACVVRGSAAGGVAPAVAVPFAGG